MINLIIKSIYKFVDVYKNLFVYPTVSIFDNTINYDDYWKEKRGKNIGSLSSWQKDRADFILNTLSVNKQEKITIADVGCGDGSILLYLKKNHSEITQCIGYDSSEYALNYAKESGIETHLTDVSKTETYKNLREADYYLLLETLEHIPQSELLLMEVLSKSKRGVFFSFPNTGYITYRLRLLFGKFPLQWRVYPNEHVRFWTLTDVRWWLRALGITKYKILCYKGVPFLNRIIPSLFGAAIIVYIDKK